VEERFAKRRREGSGVAVGEAGRQERKEEKARLLKGSLTSTP